MKRVRMEAITAVVFFDPAQKNRMINRKKVVMMIAHLFDHQGINDQGRHHD